jgi:hypothetical protein
MPLYREVMNFIDLSTYKAISKMVNTISFCDGLFSKACMTCDCKYALLGGQKKIMVFKTANGEIDNVYEEGHLSSIQAISWQPRSAQFCSGDSNGNVIIWE